MPFATRLSSNFDVGMDVDNDRKRAAAGVAIEQDDNVLMHGRSEVWMHDDDL